MKNKISGDYHQGINVIGFLFSVINQWLKIKERTISESDLNRLLNRLEVTKKKLIKRNKIGLDVKNAITFLEPKLLNEYVNNDDYSNWLVRYIKILVDFGTKQELINALYILNKLKRKMRFDNSIGLFDSINYAINRLESGQFEKAKKLYENLKNT